MKILKILTAIIWRLALLLIGGWAALVALLSPGLSESMRLPCAIIMGLFVLLSLFRPRKFIVSTLIGILAVIYIWSHLTPSNDRDWKADVAKLGWAERNGDEITIHNVRDFNYRSETDFDENYVTKRVKLSELSSLELFASYWDGMTIAHIFVSFGFANNEHVAFSIEVRNTKSQGYSTTAGFFRNFELIYVVAEERDVVGLRTRFRQPNEEVHMFRLRYYKPNLEKFFLSYLQRLNSLAKKPEFYNTLTTNCTTQVLANAEGESTRFKYDWRILLSGYTPEYLYRIGNLDSSYSMAELMQKGLVNSRAQDVSSAKQFSENIRLGVPKPEPFTEQPQ